MIATDIPWLALAASVSFGSLVQGATGFGGALISMPLLLWGGLSLPQAIAATTAATAVQTALACRHHRDDMPWKLTLPLTGFRLAFLPLGVLSLSFVSALGQVRVTQIVGWALLFVLAALLLLRPAPRPQVSWLSTAAAGASSGFLTGAFGIGGPPLVIWSLQQDWSALQVRTFLWGTSLVMTLPSLLLLTWKFGPAVLWSFLAGILVAPVVVLAAHGGMAMGHSWNRGRLRQVAYALLFLTAFMSIASPWLRPAPVVSVASTKGIPPHGR